MLTIETNKFTDHAVVLYRFLPAELAGNAAFHVLLYMLRGSNEKIERKDLFRRELMKLYDARINWNYLGYGNRILFMMQAIWIQERLIDDPGYIHALEELIKTSFEKPNLSRENFEEAKLLYTLHIRSQSDHPDALAMQTAIKAIQQDHPLCFFVTPELETVENLEYEQVVDLWKDISRREVHTAITSDPEEEILAYASSFDGKSEHMEDLLPLQVEELQERRLSKQISQASLVQIYATGILPGNPDYLALILGNALLGKSQNSLLFEVLREKHSLCYGISSNLVSLDGALVIRSEILPEGMDQALELIAEQIRRVRDGDYSDEELERARRDLISQVQLRRDVLGVLLETAIRDDYTGKPISDETVIERVRKMGREDIARAFASITLISQTIVEPEDDHAL